MIVSHPQRLTAAQFDRKLVKLRRAAGILKAATPKGGFVATIRTGLGMPRQALASRLQIDQSTLAQLEKAERAGSISLNRLRRVAAALEGELVYAIVPRQPLQKTLMQRAREVARARVAPVMRSMALEKQRIPSAAAKRQEIALAAALERRPRELWR